MIHYITDIEGNLLKITDLKEAIDQVAMYVTYMHDHPNDEPAVYAIKRTEYWKDLYTKLNLLRIKEILTS